MKHLILLPLLALGTVAACGSSPIQTESQAAPAAEPTKPSNNWKDDRRKNACPTEARIHGMINMMPGPGYNRDKVPSYVTAEIVASGYWGISSTFSEDGDTLTLKVFRSSRHVKPVARPMLPVQGQTKPWLKEDPVKDDPSQVRTLQREYKFTPAFRGKLILKCGGQVIAEGYVQAAR